MVPDDTPFSFDYGGFSMLFLGRLFSPINMRLCPATGFPCQRCRVGPTIAHSCFLHALSPVSQAMTASHTIAFVADQDGHLQTQSSIARKCRVSPLIEMPHFAGTRFGGAL